MNSEVIRGVLLPFLGTSLGAACVFFARDRLSGGVRRALTDFAAGVMLAASVWSLLLPAIGQCAALGRLAFVPAVVGFWLGALFLSLLDRAFPCPGAEGAGERHGPRARTAKLVLAVTIHNLPEGMAVGVVYAGLLRGGAGVSAAGALALALGVAIQNFPEGAIISLPLRAEGMGRGRAFFWGVLSGAVEPAGALLTLWLSALVIPALPCLLSFAAGAMVCVVVEELIPEARAGSRPGPGALMFTLGFTAMLAMDCALG